MADDSNCRHEQCLPDFAALFGSPSEEEGFTGT